MTATHGDTAKAIDRGTTNNGRGVLADGQSTSYSLRQRSSTHSVDSESSSSEYT